MSHDFEVARNVSCEESTVSPVRAILYNLQFNVIGINVVLSTYKKISDGGRLADIFSDILHCGDFFAPGSTKKYCNQLSVCLFVNY